MEGVTILQTIVETVYHPGFNWLAWVFMVTCIIGVIVYCYTNSIKIKKKIWETVIACACAVAVIGGALGCVGAILTANPETETTYQILLDDDVKMTKFREKYEIVDQQGITYIVKAVNSKG